MARRRHSKRRPKIHRSYRVDEVARLYGVHRNTVRGWVRQGLPTLDQCRPAMIRGSDLAAFHSKRRLKNKRPLAPGQIYCVRCRAPQTPEASCAEYRPLTAAGGDLVGDCPKCGAKMFRRVSLANLKVAQGDLSVVNRTKPEKSGRMAATAAGSSTAVGEPGPSRKAKEALRAALFAVVDPVAALAELGLVVADAAGGSVASTGVPNVLGDSIKGDQRADSMHGQREQQDD